MVHIFKNTVMLSLKNFIPVILIICSINLQAQLPIPEGRRIREIVADKYPDGKLLIGATTGAWGFNEPIGEIMDREFSYVTPENDFKQSVVRSDPNQWNWSHADAWLQHIIDNDQILRIHSPISPQCSKWAKDDNRTAEELSIELDTFMTALCQRYNGVEGIEYLDVVNEIALSDGSWHHPKPGTDQWENPWLKIGQDDDPNQTPLYVEQAFAIANEHAPDLKQIINNHCHPGTEGMEKVKETILYLRDKGYRVDGLGWQAHVEVGWATDENLQYLREVIDWCQSRNLEFHVTEFDAWIMNKYTQTFEQQAYTYKAIMDVLLEKLDSLTIGWNTWHITDAAGWKTERIPSLFDDKYQPKPAYFAMQLALESKGDYTTTHQVTIQAKNSETGAPIDTFECSFGQGRIKSTQNGEIIYQGINPARYTAELTKKHFNSLVKKNIIVFSDTLITLYLNPAEYNVSFRVIESNTGTTISSASVVIDTLQQQSGLDGQVSFSLKPGSYNASFSGTGYAPFEREFIIVSDTLVDVSLVSTHAGVKFKLKKNNQPVNDAMIILNNDTVYSNSLGIGNFNLLPLGNDYSFIIEKEGYKPLNGIISLHADTTVQLNMTSLYANLSFEVESEISLTGPAFIMINEDTVKLNSEDIARFYNYPVDSSYNYQFVYNNQNVKNGTFYLTADTTIHINYTITSTKAKFAENEINLYPNPASQELNIQSSHVIKQLILYRMDGKQCMKNAAANTTRATLDISKLPKGQYLITIQFESDVPSAHHYFICN